MEKGGIFENDVRTSIYEFILKNPGLHMCAISRKMNIPKSTLNYHLKCLIHDGYVIQKQNGKYSRYYVKNMVGENEKKLINLIRQEIPYRIILLLFLDPEASQTKLGEYLNRHPTTVSYHIDKLIELDMIEESACGNHVKYKLKNPSKISDLVLKYCKLFRNQFVL